MWHSRGMARRFLWVLAAPLVAAGMAAGFGPAAASAVACQNWTGVQLPSPGSVVNEVDGVTVVSPSDVWAAGFGFGNGPDQTLIEHWDGSSWTVLPSPNPGSGDNQLRGIRALSANNIWAVGSYSTGTTWAQVPSPSPGASSNTLWGVAATSASNTWATGDAASSSPDQALALHCT